MFTMFFQLLMHLKTNIPVENARGNALDIQQIPNHPDTLNEYLLYW